MFVKKQATINDDVLDYTNDLEDRISNLVLSINPIGTIYESTNPTNPSNFIGGTWEEYGKGRVLVGVDSTQTEFNTVEKVGGAKTHTLTVDEIASHGHNGTVAIGWGTLSGSGILGTTGNTGQYRTGLNIDPVGGDQPHNNLQPYITVYRFRRIA